MTLCLRESLWNRTTEAQDKLTLFGLTNIFLWICSSPRVLLMKQLQISYSTYDFYLKPKETFNWNTLQSIHRLQCNCFCSVSWFHSSVRKPFSASHNWFTSISVCVSAGEADPEPWTPRYVFSVQVKGSLVSFKCRLECACSASVRWPAAVLSCRARDLISGAGLITHQMVTECSVTKTKTNPWLD